MFKLPWGRERWLTHLALAALSLLALLLVDWLRPALSPLRRVSIATGYASLLFLVGTLLIGPIQLWRRRRRRNPANINLRRDAGIWAALTGIVHVFYSLQAHKGGQALLFFVAKTAGGYRLLTDRFGLGNYLGAAATIILVLLLLLSNDFSLRRLKGRRWKNLQRLNYLLFLLVLAHAIVYQALVGRMLPLRWLVLLLAGIVAVTQLLGVARARRNI